MSRASVILESLHESASGPEGIESTFQKASSVLNGLKAEYALVGSVALGATTSIDKHANDIDFLVDESSHSAVDEGLRKAGFTVHGASYVDHHEPLVRYQDPVYGITVDVRYVNKSDSATEGVIETAKNASVFGSKVKVATGEDLAWLYLTSDKLKHHNDLVEMIRRNVFKVSDLEKCIEDSSEPKILHRKLDELVLRAKSSA